MTHHVGLDVSVRETSICIVDEAGTILKEARVPTESSIIIEMDRARHCLPAHRA